MTRFISNSYGLFFVAVILYAVMQNSLFVIYIALVALAAGLHYIESHHADFATRFKGEGSFGFEKIANWLHIVANILLAGLVIRELFLIV